MSTAIERAIEKYGKEKVEEAMKKLQARIYQDLELDRLKGKDPEEIKSILEGVLVGRSDEGGENKSETHPTNIV